MSYQVIVPKPVQKQLDNLPASVRKRVVENILALKENPQPIRLRQAHGLRERVSHPSR
jgi:mRNA interferase RelE/StbE